MLVLVNDLLLVPDPKALIRAWRMILPVEINLSIMRVILLAIMSLCLFIFLSSHLFSEFTELPRLIEGRLITSHGRCSRRSLAIVSISSL